MSQDLLFIVEDVFSITGRGTVVAGELVAGSVSVGDDVIITAPTGEVRAVRITGISRMRELIEHASAGEPSVGLLIAGVTRDEVTRGCTLRAASAERSAESSAAAGVPAAWMSDPTGIHEWRYWDAGVVGEDAGVDAPAPSVTDVSPPAPGGDSAGPDLARMHALYAARLSKDGAGAFSHLRLDADPTPPPERVVVLTAQLGRATKPSTVLDLLDKRATIYEALEMTTEADRDRLAWAAIKEGHSGLSRTSKEWARGLFGLEYGSTFTATYDILTKKEGEKVRVALMRSGRAVALGYCPKCGRVEQMDERLRCPLGHKDPLDVACVVPQDAAAIRRALESARRG
jgi:hypothetical protein